MSARGRLFVALVSTCLVAYVAAGSVLGRVFSDTSYAQLTVFNEVVRLVLDAYVDPVNVDRAMDGAQLGLTEALDGETVFLDAEGYRAYQRPLKESDGEIGVVLTRRYGFLAVVAPRPNSPAAKAGVRSGDVIKTIDGRHTRPVTLPEGERLLRGAPGSVVKLRLLRAGSDPLDVSVVRERLAGEPPSSRLLEGGSGYLKVGEFSAATSDEVASECQALRRAGARDLVLDLRGAAYGPIESGVKAAGLFLKDGEVIARVIGRRVDEKVLKAAAPGVWDRPVAVLVDRGTSGPGEVLAAALLEDAGSPVVGERTSGRTPIQKVIPLPEGSALLLTVAKYMSPKGNAIHGKGVEPTAIVAAPQDEEEGGEGEATAKDPALDKALELLAAQEKGKAA
ncbi:MAG TPA: S41 family peptidase [Vicinamibacteria bacterium]|jgi:carboxyl-terminal processing protease